MRAEQPLRPFGLCVLVALATQAAGCAEDVPAEGAAPGASADLDPLRYHDGYWVAEVESPDLPVLVTLINDMHVDLATRAATVYAQMRALGQVVSPPQVGPGECEDRPTGRACFHPNAVYLNGQGAELAEADGPGQWWVKHAWVVGGEGYTNWELNPPREDYGAGAFLTGVWAADGVSMEVGSEDGWHNLRRPLLDVDPVQYEVTRHNPDGTVGFQITWECADEPSAFDQRARPCPVAAP